MGTFAYLIEQVILLLVVCPHVGHFGQQGSFISRSAQGKVFAMFLKVIFRSVAVLCAAVFLAATPQLVYSAGITLDHVDGEIAPGVLDTGTLITFYWRLTNDVGEAIVGVQNGYRVYSPSGATWDTLSHGLASEQPLSDVFDANDFMDTDCNGIGEDTVLIWGMALAGQSVFPDDSSLVGYSFSIGPLSSGDVGGTICIDSTWVPPAQEWLWVRETSGDINPDWGGPYCFYIGADTSCAGTDVGEVVALSDYLWHSGPMPSCGQTPPTCACADVNCSGTLDIADVAQLADYLWLSGAPLADSVAASFSECGFCDGGIKDTLALVLNADTASAKAELELWAYTDERIHGASAGFAWSEIGTEWILDSAVATAELQSYFDLGPFYFERDDDSISNANDRFLFGSTSGFSDGLPGNPSRRHWATYYFSIANWDSTAQFAVDLAEFNPGSGLQFTKGFSSTGDYACGYDPVWAGEVTYDFQDGPAEGNYALQFSQDNGGDYVEAQRWLSGVKDDWTMEVWFFAESYARDEFACLVEHRADWNDKAIRLEIGGSVRFVENYADHSKLLFASDPVALDNWHHAAMISTPTDLVFMLDGDSLGSLLRVYGSSDWTSAFFGSFIGGNNVDHNGDGLDGMIDEVRIWSVSRTPDEVRSTMYTELTGTETGLATYYNFNEGIGQTLYDQTSNGVDGRLGSSTGADSYDPEWVLRTGGLTSELLISNLPPYSDTSTCYPLAGDSTTTFEFRISYRDTAGNWPQSGSPELQLDFDYDEVTDTVIVMNLSRADSTVTDGADYSAYVRLAAGSAPWYRFEATSVTGTVLYPATGWLEGPSVADPWANDLYVYADDIIFSDSLPAVQEEVIITGRVHNNSDQAHNDVLVHLLVNDSLIDSSRVNVPGRLDGVPGIAEVSKSIIFTDSVFREIKLVVDADDAVDEWNEYNNYTLRALLVEGFTLPGLLVLDANPLGSYYPGGYISGSGSSWYEEEGEHLGAASGTPVTLTLLETGQELGTVYVNDLGNFSYGLTAPAAVGQYHLQLYTTDFTLQTWDTVVFDVVPYPTDTNHYDPPQGPNLIVSYTVQGCGLNECTNPTLTVIAPTVYNTGNLPSGSCKARLSRDGVPVLDAVDIPALEPGQFHVLQATVPLDHSGDPGNHSISAVVDYLGEVAELNESDNSRGTSYHVWCCWSDLNPTDLIFSGTAYANRPIDIKARVYNRGGIAADDFSLTFVDYHGDDTTTIGQLDLLDLSPFGAYSWFTLEDHAFSDTGMHLIRVYADSVDVLADECSEENNVYQEWVHISSPTPDLVVTYDSVYVDNPDAIEGEAVSLMAAVKNAGDSTAYDFDVFFGLNGVAHGTSGLVRVDSIPGGEWQFVTHPEPWTIDYSKCPLAVVADSGDLLDEYSEANNTVEVKTPYDFYPEYTRRCPGWSYPPPFFFNVCEADTTVDVAITLTARNSGLFNYNGSLAVDLYDSLAGAPSRTLIHSTTLSSPIQHHGRNRVSDTYVHRFGEYGTHYVTYVLNPGELVSECDYGNDTITYSIDIVPPPPPDTSRPDLVMQSRYIAMSTRNPQLGEEYWVHNVDVHNHGDTTAYNVDVLFLLDADTLDLMTLDSVPVDLYSGTPTMESDTVTVDTCRPATHVIRVVADPFGSIVELNDLNNAETKGVIYCESAELFVDAIDFDPPCGAVGDPLMVSVAIGNGGDIPGDALVNLYVSGPEGSWESKSLLTTYSIDSLLPEAKDTLTFSWSIDRSEPRIYAEIAFVYPWDYNPDSDTLSVELPDCGLCGDINADGSGPNIADLTYFVAYLFRGGPPPPFLMVADLNGRDGNINIADLTYLIAYLFRGGPAPDCEGQAPFAMVKAGIDNGYTCELNYTKLSDQTMVLSLDAEFEGEVAGIQQEYLISDASWAIDSIVVGDDYGGMEAYFNATGGRLLVGIVDIAGKQSFRAGRSQIARFYCRRMNQGEKSGPPLVHDFTIVADWQGREIYPPVAIQPGEPAVPRSYALYVNYPNPFNPSTAIRYALPERVRVNISIYNILGQQVKVLVDSEQEAGFHEVIWNGTDGVGRSVATGVYLYQIEAGDYIASRKMLLLK